MKILIRIGIFQRATQRPRILLIDNIKSGGICSVNYYQLLRENPYFPTGSFRKEDITAMKLCHSLAIGDLVLMTDENVHRAKWPLGTVTDVFRRKDENFRSTNVLRSLTVLTRPVKKIMLLGRRESALILVTERVSSEMKRLVTTNRYSPRRT